MASVSELSEQMLAVQAALGGVSDRLSALSSRLEELVGNFDAQEVSVAVSTAVIEDGLAEHSRELSLIREDLDELRSTIDAQ